MIYWYKRIHGANQKELFLYGQKGDQIVERMHIVAEGPISEWEIAPEGKVYVFYPHKVRSYQLQQFGVSSKHDFIYQNPLRIAKIVMENYQDWMPGEVFVEDWTYSKFRLILMKIANCKFVDGNENGQMEDQRTHYPTFDLIGKYQIIQVPERIAEQYIYAEPPPDVVGIVIKEDSMITYSCYSIGLPPGIYLMYYARY
ncbi:hypothetical protein AZ268_gp43 [Acidianus rod-shaped virus 2]|uniref:Uncharacterized protein n=1 Tax=Acidianus rod-shaped virus 2 TaxID=1732175 RepID=A0A0N9PB55_9VIRU|nr:hypothetical protein AZ268_gp43 [Acidianus rod-shaped virus 2]ALG96911.1 hypothetical protein [Acidianus rod-shaped virus 2]